MDSHLNELQLDLEEITKFESLATREGMRGKLTIWKSQIEKEIEQIRMRETQQQKNMETEQAVTPKPKIHTKKITTYAWDQSDKFIKVFVSNLKGVQDIPRENIIVECNGQQCTLTVKELNNMTYVLNLPKLLKDISEGTCKVKKDEIILMLKKAKPGNWEVFWEKDKKEVKQSDMIPELDKDEDPSKGIMSMMKKMYDEGDDDMKRMISKAWTESREKQLGAGELK